MNEATGTRLEGQETAIPVTASRCASADLISTSAWHRAEEAGLTTGVPFPLPLAVPGWLHALFLMESSSRWNAEEKVRSRRLHLQHSYELKEQSWAGARGQMAKMSACLFSRKCWALP